MFRAGLFVPVVHGSTNGGDEVKRPSKCPICKQEFPSMAARNRHWGAACCRDPKHIACSECDANLKALSKELGSILRGVL
jgi:hypothetical protein